MTTHPTDPPSPAVDSAAGLHRRSIDRIDRTIDALARERQRHRQALFARARDASRPVAYQGAPGSFSEDAATAIFGADAALAPCRTLDAVFDAIAEGSAASGVVPIENTLAGPVPGCADLVARHDVHLTAERVQRIAHALVAAPGVALTDVRRVFSHPVAIAQCERFFRAHPEITPVPAFDTAGAVAEVTAQGLRDAAAIASARTAAVYGGVVLMDQLQDTDDNFTRFLVVEPGPAPPASAGCKTSVLFTLRHEPGALVRALLAFSSRGLDLCRIESRPVRDTPFEYAFHVDVGPATDAGLVEAALADLARGATALRVLGHYPPE